MPQKILTVPSAACPAIIGLKGSKLKDTERVTNTRIQIPRHRSGETKLTITGNSEEDVNRASHILQLAVLHFKASTSTPPEPFEGGADAKDAARDAVTIFVEIQNSAV